MEKVMLLCAFIGAVTILIISMHMPCDVITALKRGEKRWQTFNRLQGARIQEEQKRRKEDFEKQHWCVKIICSFLAVITAIGLHIFIINTVLSALNIKSHLMLSCQIVAILSIFVILGWIIDRKWGAKTSTMTKEQG